MFLVLSLYMGLQVTFLLNNDLKIGVGEGNNICKVFFMDLNAVGDTGFIIRAQQTNGVIYDVHLGTNELSFYKSKDNGATFDLIWTCNIVKH